MPVPVSPPARTPPQPPQPLAPYTGQDGRPTRELYTYLAQLQAWAVQMHAWAQAAQTTIP